MKLTTILIMVTMMQVSAATFAQKVTFIKKNAKLGQLFYEIRKQTGYHVVWSQKKIVNLKPFNMSFSNASITDVLDKALNGLPLIYEIQEKIVLIKEKSFPDKVIELSQTVDIKGRVFDETRQPLVGATIFVKGSSKTTTTNAQGEFGLKGVEESSVLVISFIGYKNKEVNVGKTRDFTINMTIAASELEKVTVVSTGYQTISKERATGAFNVVSKEQLEKSSPNIAQRLIGAVAGMQTTLDENGNPKFEIRGQTSLNSNASPLVVVDGFPVQGDFSTINPNDVESVTVLKDAAAASIWGAKSANGVIVVVTKKAKRNTPLKVGFSAFTRFANKPDLDYINPLASSREAVEYQMRSFGNWGNLTNEGIVWDVNTGIGDAAFIILNEFYLGKITASQRDAQLEQLRNNNNKEQIKNELLSNSVFQQYNLSLSGGSEKMSHKTSLLFEDNQTAFKNTNNKKYIFSYSTDAEPFNWLQFSFSGLVNYNKINNNGVSLEDIQSIAPYQMLKNEDGSLADLSGYYKPTINTLVPKSSFPYADWSYNPIQEIANRKITTENLNSRLQTGLKFKIIKGLTFDTRIQYELFNTNYKGLYNENTFKVRDLINTSSTWDQETNKVTANLPKGSILEQSRIKTEAYSFRNLLNFDRKFGEKHEINLIAGSEINSSTAESFINPTTYGFNEQTLSVGSFPNGPGGSAPLTDWMGWDQTFSYTNTFTSFTERYFSLFANSSYTFNNKYSLSGSVRTDASNLITDDPSYRYSPFWSVGMSWKISEENFMKDVKWIDRLAVRATFGYNGNVDRSTSFRPLISMKPATNVFTGDYNATISSFGNPNLRWEKTGTWNLGLDYSMFNGQLFGKLDVYNKTGKDLIATISIPAINGTDSQKMNNAEMTNRGIELELGTVQRLDGDNITWKGNFNFSYNKNKINKLFVANYDAYTLTNGGTGAYVEGANANDLWRFQYAGLNNGQPTVQGPNGTTYDFTTWTPGDGRTYLVNMGTAVAPYTAGFINSFKVYDFNLSFIVTGKFGHVFQRKSFNYPVDGQFPNSKISEVLNGDPSKIVPLPQNQLEPRYYFWDRFYPYLSYLIENASHIRMQEVNLTYNVPSSIISKAKMSRLQLFVQGNDLFTIIANDANEDPEYPLGTFKPQPRLSLGIKCEF